MIGAILGKDNKGIVMLAYGEYTQLALLFDTYKELGRDMELRMVSMDREHLDLILEQPDKIEELFSNQFDV